MTFENSGRNRDQVSFCKSRIEILPHPENARIEHYEVESDWSSASYFYSLAAIGRKSINLRSYHTLSLQGDSVIKEIYWKYFGINTVSDYAENSISLLPEPAFEYPELISLDMNDCPDIAKPFVSPQLR
jgi:3-phosphoshikimate 1-carboxyvinyltransferase